MRLTVMMRSVFMGRKREREREKKRERKKEGQREKYFRVCDEENDTSSEQMDTRDERYDSHSSIIIVAA